MQPDGKNDDESMPDTADWIILDSSALIAFLAKEPRAQAVTSYRSRLAIPFIALTELMYFVWRRLGEEEAVAHCTLVTEWNRPILWPDEKILITAARFKAQYSLGLADSFIAAFSRVYQAPLLTKDRDYRRLRGEVTLIELA